MSETTYKLVPLLSMKQHYSTGSPELEPSEKEKIKSHLEQFHVVLKIVPSWHTDASSQKEVYMMKVYEEVLMLSTKTQKFGITNFQVETDMKPDATSDEIKATLQKFNSSLYKEQSKKTYLDMVIGDQNLEKAGRSIPTTKQQD